ncbi:MAG: hypothetical protein JJ863_15925 [Deltaproteobacteria bacterium]|nr:hypothetical protein [Deltaproteobacteria bacterium]
MKDQLGAAVVRPHRLSVSDRSLILEAQDDIALILVDGQFVALPVRSPSGRHLLDEATKVLLNPTAELVIPEGVSVSSALIDPHQAVDRLR